MHCWGDRVLWIRPGVCRTSQQAIDLLAVDLYGTMKVNVTNIGSQPRREPEDGHRKLSPLASLVLVPLSSQSGGLTAAQPRASLDATSLPTPWCVSLVVSPCLLLVMEPRHSLPFSTAVASKHGCLTWIALRADNRLFNLCSQDE